MQLPACAQRRVVLRACSAPCLPRRSCQVELSKRQPCFSNVHQMLCLDNEERCHGCLPPITSGHAHPNLQLAPPPQRAAAGERDAGGDAAQA